MAAPNDAKRSMLTDRVLPLNWRIALAKGWQRVSYNDEQIKDAQGEFLYFYWVSNSGVMQAKPPDYVGTLEGVSGLMREIMENGSFHPVWSPQAEGYLCAGTSWSQCWFSNVDHPGDCVGEAWMSIHGEEKADGCTEA